MKHECGIVRDLLPLCLEDMTRQDTAAFVTRHLETCEECYGEYKKLKSNEHLDRPPEPEAGDPQALVQIKKKLRAGRVRTVCLTVAITAVVVFAWFLFSWPFSVHVDYGTSERYTQAELEAAVRAVKLDFSQMPGCKLYTLTYAGDERSQAELEYQNRDRAPGTEYTDCVVFNSLFRSPVLGVGAWEDNALYHWSWTVARTGDGLWTVLDKGYA